VNTADRRDKGKQQSGGEFLSDVKELRRRAREHMDDGAVTESHQVDREALIRLLNTALAIELICVLRYRRHHFMAAGIHAQGVAEEFMKHAREEQGHADKIAKRIVQLGGEPDFSPEGLATRSHSEYVEGGDLVDMIQENLFAERIAIESYLEMIRFMGEGDPTARRMLEEILGNEEEHADELKTLLEQLGEPRK
jgi:bacterioferritin